MSVASGCALSCYPHLERRAYNHFARSKSLPSSPAVIVCCAPTAVRETTRRAIAETARFMMKAVVGGMPLATRNVLTLACLLRQENRESWDVLLATRSRARFRTFRPTPSDNGVAKKNNLDPRIQSRHLGIRSESKWRRGHPVRKNICGLAGVKIQEVDLILLSTNEARRNPRPSAGFGRGVFSLQWSIHRLPTQHRQ